MIFDDFKNLSRYPQIPFLHDIHHFIEKHYCSKLQDGEVEILGRDLFVRIAEYDTGPAEEKKFEAHTVYADLQYLASGKEIMGFSSETAKPVTNYDPKADIRFFEITQKETPLLVSAGQFTVFFPGELHRPGCLAGPQPEKVKKLVFKIKMAR